MQNADNISNTENAMCLYEVVPTRVHIHINT